VVAVVVGWAGVTPIVELVTMLSIDASVSGAEGSELTVVDGYNTVGGVGPGPVLGGVDVATVVTGDAVVSGAIVVVGVEVVVGAVLLGTVVLGAGGRAVVAVASFVAG